MIKISALLPSKFWDFIFSVFLNSSKKENLLISKWINLTWNFTKSRDSILVRIHSKCVTWDVFGSKRCDCWQQLEDSLKLIQKEWKWVLIYLNQEWRWIWLIDKIKAYVLQDNGFDTVQANQKLWFDVDLRNFKDAADILKKIWVKNIRLITNNPKKKKDLEENWIIIDDIVVIKSVKNKCNEKYLKTKIKKMWHKIEF